MVLFKSRSVSEELKRLRCLHVRMDFSEDDKGYYANLEKGFDGEKKFDLLIGDLSDNWLIINDLLLKYNNTLFQIDSLFISHDMICAYDVKNYDGDFYLEGKDRWYTASGKEIKSPLEQLTRSESLLRRLLHDLGFQLPIESKLIFVNPKFYLYQAPLNLPSIFPAQLERFINKLPIKTGKLNNRHYQLAERLVSLHIKNGPITRVPVYSYEKVKKGIICSDCWNSFMNVFNKETLVCMNCGHEESVDSAVLRSVGEYSMLFPELKITTNAIYSWCKIITSRKAIRRILAQNYKPIGNTKAVYYVDYEKK